MADNLVIVESPAKAKTIQKFLGNGYVVKSSFGHIRDLQDKKLSVDVEKGFTPEYVIPSDKKKVVAELKKAAESFGWIFLHRIGESSNPTSLSRTLRACWALTRFMSMERGFCTAFTIASLVIS